MKILVDCYGGDNSPKAMIDGSVTAVNLKEDLEITLVGKEIEIKAELDNLGYNGTQLKIMNASEVITCEETPTSAIRQKTDSSLVVALDALKNNEEFDALVSAGSTGAVLTGALLKVGRIKGISRPATGPILPNQKGGKTLLLDSGANVDSKPQFLVDFALMGTAYMQSVYGIEKPRVALVNVGTEDKKGNDLTHEVFALLKDNPMVNFVGNMEARDALSGDYDVLVCDGFVGNVLLKATEGTANFILKALKEEIDKSNIFGKLGALMLKKAFKRVKQKLDYNAVGGAPFLGIEKTIIKAHGSANAKCFYSAIVQAEKMVENKLVENIKQAVTVGD